MTLHERTIAQGLVASSSVEEAVTRFIDQLTHIPDPVLRRYCQEQITGATTIEDMAAAVRLVQNLSACFAPAAPANPPVPEQDCASATL